MTPNIEPTYLRYIYDGLIKGSVHPENAAELPDGLIGMYEEAFDERTSVVERQKLLQRFAIWALLKKEVSAAFFAEILGETEDDIQEFISTYSAWFNSPESGKYQLYHERLKVYLLQKMSEGEVHMLHEKLIGRLEQAIEEQKADEFEWYGLEFLTSHLTVAAMLNGAGKKLIELAYSQTHWQRQLKISKGYSWTNSGLKEVMTWASKYNDDEVIECGLQMVDLHHQEQNAAPQIVAMVAEGEFDAALKRIEQFGGVDKEDLQRRFILYMLCLMELTLLGSKNKPYRKEGIDKLLKHLDEQLPVDHSVLNWNDFVSSFQVFNLACECAKLGSDYLIIYKRTDKWDYEWLLNKLEFSEFQINVLYEIAKEIKDELVFNKVQVIIFLLKNEIKNCLKQAKKINNSKGDRSQILSLLATKLNTEEKDGYVDILMNEGLKFARQIESERERSFAISMLAIESIKHGNTEKCENLLQEAIEIKKDVVDYLNKIEIIRQIEELSIDGKLDEALDQWKKLWHFEKICYVLSKIAHELAKLGNFDKALNYARSITSNSFKSISLSTISTVYLINGQTQKSRSILKEAIELLNEIDFTPDKFITISKIAIELSKQGNLDDFLKMVRKAVLFNIDFEGEFVDHEGESEKDKILCDIYLIFIKESLFKEAQEFLVHIKHSAIKNKLISTAATFLIEKGFFEESSACTLQSLSYRSEVNSDKFRNDCLSMIANEYARNQLFESAIIVANQITEQHEKVLNFEKILVLADEVKDKPNDRVKLEISKIFITEAQNFLNNSNDQHLKISILRLLASSCIRLGNEEGANLYIEQIGRKWWKCITYRDISSMLFTRGKHEASSLFMTEAISFASNIENEFGDKCDVLQWIALSLIKQNKLEYAKDVINEALNNLEDVVFETDKCRVLGEIAVRYFELGDVDKSLLVIEEAISFANSIEDEYEKAEVLSFLSSVIFKIGNKDMAISKLNDAFLFAIQITDLDKYNNAVTLIAVELVKQNNIKLAELVCMKIEQISVRNNCWKKIAIVELGLKRIESINAFNLAFESQEANNIFSREWVNNMTLKELKKKIILAILPRFVNETTLMITILQKHALNELFLETIPQEKIDRFDSTLNIQWAIEIKNQLNNNLV